jgi:hypothetical protein
MSAPTDLIVTGVGAFAFMLVYLFFNGGTDALVAAFGFAIINTIVANRA